MVVKTLMQASPAWVGLITNASKELARSKCKENRRGKQERIVRFWRMP